MISYAQLGIGGSLDYVVGASWAYVRNSSHTPDVFLLDADADTGL